MHRQQHRHALALLRRAVQQQQQKNAVTLAPTKHQRQQERSYAKTKAEYLAEKEIKDKLRSPPVTNNWRGSIQREEGDFDEKYGLVDHNRVYPNAARNRYFVEKGKNLSGKKTDSLDDQNMRPKLTEDDVNKDVDEKITKLRGGMHKFDGVGDANELNGSWEELSFYVENAAPEFHYNHKSQLNKDKASWMYDENVPSGKETNYSAFELNVDNWRRGRMTNRNALALTFKYQALQLPIFRRKPVDPFARKSHLIKRISYKNVDELAKFLSGGGNILGRRHTGLRLRAQNAVVREIKKARFLGLISFTSNPYYASLENQPMAHSMTEEQKEEIRDLERGTEVDYLDLYLENLQDDVSTTGSFEWDPPKSITNPKHSLSDIELEHKGQLEEQMLKKKELLKKWMLENRMLQKFKTVATKEAVEKLTDIIQRNRVKEAAHFDTQQSSATATATTA